MNWRYLIIFDKPRILRHIDRFFLFLRSYHSCTLRWRRKRKPGCFGPLSHAPDHPPLPSKTDESQPMLSGWINVIASVHGGKFKEAKAWWREDDAKPFLETPLDIKP